MPEAAVVNGIYQKWIALVDDLDERIAALARECPTEWGGEKSDIDGKMSQITHKWKEVWGAMGEKEYGLGGA